MLVGVYEQPLTWDPLQVISKNLSLVRLLGGQFPRFNQSSQRGKSQRQTHDHASVFPLIRQPRHFRTQLTDPAAIKVMFKLE